MTSRFHGLDACRAAAMLLGLFFHGSISFMEMPGPWAVQDRSTDRGVDAFVWICHSFRMPVFFLLAGFFGRLLHEKLGAAGFLRHRAKRLLLPFVVTLIPLIPTLFLLWKWGWAGSGPRPKDILGVETPSLELDRIRLSPGHLWFLYYLMMILLLGVSLVALGRRLGLAAVGRSLDAVLRGLVQSRLVAVVMAVPTALALAFMQTPAADTPIYFSPEPRILAYYGIFTAFGWLLHRQAELVEEFGRRLWVPLLLALAGIAPLGLLVERLVQGGPALSAGARIGISYLGALFGWSLVLVFLGAFVKWGSTPKPWVKWLSDASYWCYLVHLPVVVCFQILVAPLEWPGPLKYALLMAATLGVCLGTYRAFVRYTFIGATLNGPREKPLTP
jgi:peptidoglycan/LPS O-acetylase OafA/YrhL